MLRSSLKCIQLIAVVTYHNLVEYGYDDILNPFIEDMNKLSMVLLCCSLLSIIYLLCSRA